MIGHESWRTLVNVQAQLADQTVFSFAKCVTKSDFAYSRAYPRFFLFAVLLFHSGFLNTP